MTAFKGGDPLTINRLYGRSSGHKLRAVRKELRRPPAAGTGNSSCGRDLCKTAVWRRQAACISKSASARANIWPSGATCFPIMGSLARSHFSMASLQRWPHIRDKRLANIRLWRGDALEVLQRIPDGALSFLYLLHPDPWPKARHAKRRMMNDGPGRLVRRQASNPAVANSGLQPTIRPISTGR